jgi:hypothetical protein
LLKALKIFPEAMRKGDHDEKIDFNREKKAQNRKAKEPFVNDKED